VTATGWDHVRRGVHSAQSHVNRLRVLHFVLPNENVSTVISESGRSTALHLKQEPSITKKNNCSLEILMQNKNSTNLLLHHIPSFRVVLVHPIIILYGIFHKGTEVINEVLLVQIAIYSSRKFSQRDQQDNSEKLTYREAQEIHSSLV
jgi:hypothetical protein